MQAASENFSWLPLRILGILKLTKQQPSAEARGKASERCWWVELRDMTPIRMADPVTGSQKFKATVVGGGGTFNYQRSA